MNATAVDPAPFQQWINERVGKDDGLIWGKAGVNQSVFLRDQIHRALVGARSSMNVVAHPLVVSSHFSKSVELPVLRYHVGETRITVRGNFYDWKVTVQGTTPVEDIFGDLLTTREKIKDVYCEGFAREWVLGTIEQDPCNFTVEVMGDNYLFHTFMYLLGRQLRRESV